MKSWKTVLSVTIIPVLSFWLWLRFLVWEPSSIEQGSLTYWVKVPQSVKSMRLWLARGKANYDVRIGDGPVPAHVRICYRAGGGLTALKDALVRDGFFCEQSDATEISCKRRREEGEDEQLYAKYDWLSDETSVSIDKSIF